MGLSLSFSFGECNQFLGHPLPNALRHRIINANVSIVPVVATAFGSASALVIFSLFETEQDSVHHFAPVLKLNPAPHDGQTGRPILRRGIQFQDWSEVM